MAGGLKCQIAAVALPPLLPLLPNLTILISFKLLARWKMRIFHLLFPLHSFSNLYKNFCFLMFFSLVLLFFMNTHSRPSWVEYIFFNTSVAVGTDLQHRSAHKHRKNSKKGAKSIEFCTTFLVFSFKKKKILFLFILLLLLLPFFHL